VVDSVQRRIHELCCFAFSVFRQGRGGKQHTDVNGGVTHRLTVLHEKCVRHGTGADLWWGSRVVAAPPPGDEAVYSKMGALACPVSAPR
jgi:hypothetical protein